MTECESTDRRAARRHVLLVGNLTTGSADAAVDVWRTNPPGVDLVIVPFAGAPIVLPGLVSY